MKLCSVEFGYVFNASGARNFFGAYDSYWHSRLANWEGATFQSKTATLASRMDPAKKRGNMAIDPHTLRPKEWKPACIKVYPRRQVTLNAVGLAGPGFPDLLGRGQWQQRTRPLLISVAAEAKTPADITAELGELARVFLRALPYFRAPVAVVQNVTCPNLGHAQANVVAEALAGLEALQALKRPIILNINVLVKPAVAAELAKHPACAGFSLTNTVPFGQLPDRIDWVGLFGGLTSPLQHLGGGGLSGPPLLALVEEWLQDFRTNYNPTFPIMAGGGIFSPPDGLRLARAGADALFIGTMSMYHPLRVQPTIMAANAYFQERR